MNFSPECEPARASATAVAANPMTHDLRRACVCACARCTHSLFVADEIISLRIFDDDDEENGCARALDMPTFLIMRHSHLKHAFATRTHRLSTHSN